MLSTNTLLKYCRIQSGNNWTHRTGERNQADGTGVSRLLQEDWRGRRRLSHRFIPQHVSNPTKPNIKAFSSASRTEIGHFLIEFFRYLLNPNMEIVRMFGLEYTAEQLSEAILAELKRSNKSTAESWCSFLDICRTYLLGVLLWVCSERMRKHSMRKTDSTCITSFYITAEISSIPIHPIGTLSICIARRAGNMVWIWIWFGLDRLDKDGILTN